MKSGMTPEAFSQPRDSVSEERGQGVGSPSGDCSHATHMASFEAATLNEFLIGFRRVGPELERLAQVVERPRLRLVSGGRA